MRQLTRNIVPAHLVVAACISWPAAAHATTLDLEDLFSTPERLAPAVPFTSEMSPDLRDLLQQGEQALLDNEFERSAELAEQVTTRAPDAAEGWHLLGLAQANLGDAESAIASLGQAGDLYTRNAEPYIVQGDLLLSLSDAEAASAAFERAVSRDPENWRAHEGLARALAATGDTEGSRAAWRDAAAALEAAGPDGLGPRIDLAQALARSGDVGAAVTLLSNYAEAHPDDPQALLMHGRMLIVADDYDTASEVLARAADLSGDPVPALLAKATSDERRGDLDAARDSLLSAREIAPETPLIDVRLGEIALAAGDTEAAVAHFETAVASSEEGALARNARLLLAGAYLLAGRPGEVEGALAPLGEAAESDTARTLRARAALAEGDIDTARAAVQNAASAAPYVSVADTLVESGEFDAAEAVLEDARAAYPEAVEPPARLGRLFGALRRYDESLAAFRTALDRSPGRPDLLRGARAAAHRLDDLETARAYAETLVSSDSAEAQDFVWLGSIAEGQGDAEAARAAYERAIEMQPENWIALNNLAQVLIDNAPERSVELARRAADLAPDVPEIRHTLGWSLYLVGEVAEAEQVYGLLAEEEPDAARTAYRFGRILLEGGHEEAGLSELQRALDLNANFESADVARDILSAR